MQNSYTANDIAFANECGNILSYQDKAVTHSHLLVKFNLNPANCISDLDLFFNVIKYLTIQESLSDIDMSLSRLERIFNHVIWNHIDKSDENIKHAAKTWVQFHEIYRYYRDLIQESEQFAVNMPFKKAMYKGKKVSVSSCIDLLLVQKGKPQLVTFTPYVTRSETTHVLSNIDTILCIDYLLEANINLNSVIQIGISPKPGKKDYIISKAFIDKHVINFVNQQIKNICDPVVKTTHCPACVYKNDCNFKDLLYGRKRKIVI